MLLIYLKELVLTRLDQNTLYDHRSAPSISLKSLYWVKIIPYIATIQALLVLGYKDLFVWIKSVILFKKNKTTDVTLVSSFYVDTLYIDIIWRYFFKRFFLPIFTLK